MFAVDKMESHGIIEEEGMNSVSRNQHIRMTSLPAFVVLDSVLEERKLAKSVKDDLKVFLYKCRSNCERCVCSSVNDRTCLWLHYELFQNVRMESNDNVTH